MEDWYVNGILLLYFNDKVLFYLWVMLSFSELQSVHAIVALNQLHVIHT